MKMLYLACIKHSAVTGCHAFCLKKKKKNLKAKIPNFITHTKNVS